jgi:F0F1-type ATP synthase membrane subunit b/b'
MEMRFLVDRLEEIVNDGRRVPFGRLLLDEAQLVEIIDQMHVTEPNEVNQARRIILEREQILSQAQLEADNIVTMARDRVKQLLSEDGLMLEAKSHAEQILSAARRDGEALREDAEAYAIEVLAFIDDTLSQNLEQVRASLERMRNQQI